MVAFYQRSFPSKVRLQQQGNFSKEGGNLPHQVSGEADPLPVITAYPWDWNIRHYSNTVTGSFAERRNRMDRFWCEETLNMHLMQSSLKIRGLRTWSELTSSNVVYLLHIIQHSLLHTHAHGTQMYVHTQTHTQVSLYISILPRLSDKSIPKNLFFYILLKKVK